MTRVFQYDQQRLIELVKQLALRTGQFTLASGESATYYLDCRKLTLNGEGANLVAAGMLDLMLPDMPDAVGGMAIGADPITAAVIALAYQRGYQLSGFIVRKEAKTHGTGQQVEGPVEPGQTAIVVEDVATSGASCLAAAERAREFGMTVHRALAIVDRQAGATERLAAADIELQSLLNIGQLGINDTHRSTRA